MLSYFITGYTIIALAVGLLLLKMFIQDYTVSITDRMSWVVLICAALFWPIVLPISVREKMTKKQNLYSSQQKLNLQIEKISNQQLSELGTYPKA